LQSWQLAAKRLLAAAYSPRYLLATNCATAGSLFVLADCAAQRIETLAGGSSAIRAHDWRRSGRLGLIGLIGAVPAHYWYLALDRRLPGRDTWNYAGQDSAGPGGVLASASTCAFFSALPSDGRRGPGATGLSYCRDKFPPPWLSKPCVWARRRSRPAEAAFFVDRAWLAVWDVFLSLVFPPRPQVSRVY
uniref:PXMP2 protein n=1 Tax=Macrostomum lignano TaxID=282301 RepID=A0A1I8GQS8_9PLAT